MDGDRPYDVIKKLSPSEFGVGQRNALFSIFFIFARVYPFFR
jgi:hypothetical protein